MDIPCAILIAAFCLPETNLQVEVKSDMSGATAIAKFSDVRVSIPLPTDGEEIPRTILDNQLCLDGDCIPYTARLREDASSVDLLIAEPDGRERFIQLKGPVEQIAALSNHITFVYQTRGRWERVPLGEFKVAQGQAALAQEPEPEVGPEPEPEVGPEISSGALPDPTIEPQTEAQPPPLPENELGASRPAEPRPEPEVEPEWLKPNRPY